MGKFFKMAESYNISKKDWNSYRNKKALERIVPVSAIAGIAGFGIGAGLSKRPIKGGLLVSALAGSAAALYGATIHNKNKPYDFKQVMVNKTPRKKLYDNIGIEGNSTDLRIHPLNGAESLYLLENPGRQTATLYNVYADGE